MYSAVKTWVSPSKGFLWSWWSFSFSFNERIQMRNNVWIFCCSVTMLTMLLVIPQLTFAVECGYGTWLSVRITKQSEAVKRKKWPQEDSNPERRKVFSEKGRARILGHQHIWFERFTAMRIFADEILKCSIPSNFFFFFIANVFCGNLTCHFSSKQRRLISLIFTASWSFSCEWNSVFAVQARTNWPHSQSVI